MKSRSNSLAQVVSSTNVFVLFKSFFSFKSTKFGQGKKEEIKCLGASVAEVAAAEWDVSSLLAYASSSIVSSLPFSKTS